MQIKVLATALLAFAITACAAVPGTLEARYDDKFPCRWYGDGPYCKGYCPHGTYKLTTGKGGCHNGKHCEKGEKWYCCKDYFKAPKCKWYGTAPYCNEKCPKGTYEVAKDGDNCRKGCKVYCCENYHKHDN